MHSISFHNLNKINNPELWELNISLAIRSLGAGLVDIFIPIFLYQNGLSLTDIFFFYALVALGGILLSPLIAILVAKIGPKHSLVLNIPFQIGFYFMVSKYVGQTWYMLVLAIVLAISYSLFRQGMHIQIAQHSPSQKQGQELGTIRAMQISAKSLSPLLGGLLVVFYGANISLIAAAVILVISAVPLLLTKDKGQIFEFKWGKIFHKRKPREFVSLFASGLEYESNLIIWPIILVVFLGGSYATTGLITSVGLLASIAASFFIGKYSDSHRNWLIFIGTVGSFLAWLGRAVVGLGWQIFAVDSLYNFSDTVKSIPYDSKIYDKFRQEDMMSYLVYHQLAVNFGRLALFGLLFYVPNIFYSVWLGAGSTWFHLLL